MRTLETDRHRLAPSYIGVAHGERSYRKWPHVQICDGTRAAHLRIRTGCLDENELRGLKRGLRCLPGSAFGLHVLAFLLAGAQRFF